MIPISISNMAWLPQEQDAIAEVLAQLEISGIEVAPGQMLPNNPSPSLEDAKAYKQYWTKKNIQIVALQSLLFPRMDLTLFESAEKRKETVEHLSHIIEIGATLGAKILVFGSPKNRNIGSLTLEEASSSGKEFFSEVADKARQYDILFCLEPNTSAYGCDFITNTQEGVEFVSFVDHPNFKLHLDTSTMTLNKENYQESITLALPFTAHFHLSEPFLAPLSSGEVDHQAIANILKNVQYNHWVSIEMKRASEENVIQVVTESLQKVIAAYR
jgi:D-psicose/D-tagatose/L-ribulose 3-epimerase